MSEPQQRLEAGLRRMFEAIERADRDIAQRAAALEAAQGVVPAAMSWRDLRRAEKHRRRELRRARREMWRMERTRFRSPTRDILRGGMFIAFAAVLGILGLNGSPEWYLWVSLGLGIAGASQLARGLDNRRSAASEPVQTPVASAAPVASAKPAPVAVPPPPVADPETARVNEVGEKLIRELETGPEALREIVRRPRETVEGLRRGYFMLLGREKALRAGCSAEETARVEVERKSLTERIDRATDAATKSGYQKALEALEVQQHELTAMATAAGRLEAERTRLRLTLEGLHTQVIRARALQGGESAEALRRTMERLSDEVGAIASALEEVHAPAALPAMFSPIAPIEAPGAEAQTAPATRLQSR